MFSEGPVGPVELEDIRRPGRESGEDDLVPPVVVRVPGIDREDRDPERP